MKINDLITSLPVLPQRQDSASNQLADLRQIANKLGLYDAADIIEKWYDNLPDPEYGCHCYLKDGIDLEDGIDPDGCVIDKLKFDDCIYAKKGMRKEQCEYWKIVSN